MANREEQALVNQIMTYLTYMGILHVHHRTTGVLFRRKDGTVGFGKSRFQDAQRGAPDLLAWHQGKFYAIECKSKKGSITKEQMDWLARFAQAGGYVLVAKEFEQVEELFSRK